MTFYIFNFLTTVFENPESRETRDSVINTLKDYNTRLDHRPALSSINIPGIKQKKIEDRINNSNYCS